MGDRGSRGDQTAAAHPRHRPLVPPAQGTWMCVGAGWGSGTARCGGGGGASAQPVPCETAVGQWGHHHQNHHHLHDRRHHRCAGFRALTPARPTTHRVSYGGAQGIPCGGPRLRGCRGRCGVVMSRILCWAFSCLGWWMRTVAGMQGRPPRFVLPPPAPTPLEKIIVVDARRALVRWRACRAVAGCPRVAQTRAPPSCACSLFRAVWLGKKSTTHFSTSTTDAKSCDATRSWNV